MARIALAAGLALPLPAAAQGPPDPAFTANFDNVLSALQDRPADRLRRALGDEVELLLLGGQLTAPSPTTGRGIALDFENVLIARVKATCCPAVSSCFLPAGGGTARSTAAGAVSEAASTLGLEDDPAMVGRIAAALSLIMAATPDGCACGSADFDRMLACTPLQ